MINSYLDKVLKEFTTSNKLELWQEKVDELFSGVILDSKNKELYFNEIPYNNVLELRVFYLQQAKQTLDVLDSLLWIGLSNLYGGYKSSYSLTHLNDLLSKFKGQEYLLPDLNMVDSCKIVEDGNWGKRREIDSIRNQ